MQATQHFSVYNCYIMLYYVYIVILCNSLLFHILCFDRYHVIDKDTTQIFPSGVRSTPEYAWPLDIENKDEVAKSPGHLWTLGCSNSFGRGNPIGCLKKMGKPGQHKILYPLYVLKDICIY